MAVDLRPRCLAIVLGQERSLVCYQAIRSLDLVLSAMACLAILGCYFVEAQNSQATDLGLARQWVTECIKAAFQYCPADQMEADE